MADGSYTRVQFASLQAGEADFARAYAQLTETISTLESQLNTNLSMWVGSAQTAYHEAQAVWHNAEQNMAAVMQHLGAVIGTANENYINTEAANARAWA